MTTPLFLLRCVQLGISIRDLDLLTIGMVNDMFVESRNDEYKGWRQVATQEDFEKLLLDPMKYGDRMIQKGYNGFIKSIFTELS